MGKRSGASAIALAGVMAALAVSIMCLVGLIPVATFVCPVACMVLLALVCRICGDRIGWAWFLAVATLSVLLGPDKEAAVLFAALGWYPIVEPKLAAIRPALLRWLVKLAIFHIAVGAAYGFLLFIIGMPELMQELKTTGAILGGLTWAMGVLCFLLLDRLLSRFHKR